MKNVCGAADEETVGVQQSISVGIVIPCFNHGHYLANAVASVLEQTYRPTELIVVDDGSTDDTAAVCRRFPEVRYVYQPNAGLAAARNTGLRATTSTFICFLDADDLLLPHAIETGVAALLEHQDWAYVYGGHTVVTANRRVLKTVEPDHGEVPYHHLLKGNFVGMHATVLYRREALIEAGGFDTGLAACEDYDMLLRIARARPVGSHGVVIAEYRQHGTNMSQDAERMLTSSIAVLEAQRSKLRCAVERAALAAGMKAMRRNHGGKLIRQALRDLARPSRAADGLRRLNLVRRAIPRPYLAVLMAGPRSILSSIYRSLPAPLAKWTRAALHRARGEPAEGDVNFGELRRLQPIDGNFGYGRGLPIDRFYIEDFLTRHSGDVKGRVLEVKDNAYTKRFGGDRLVQSDVVDIRPEAPGVTIVADLTDAPHIPDDVFDCIILTQTLQFIYDVPRALETLRRILRPGGVLLLTVPGLSQVDRGQGRDSWYWLITAPAMDRLLADGWTDVSIETHGNVLSAMGLLQGLAADELTKDELLAHDPAYQVIVAARATKAVGET